MTVTAHKKILYFDVETTGLDSNLNYIIQLSGIIEIDGKVRENFNFKVRPVNWVTISPEALQVTGVTIEQLRTSVYKEVSAVHAQFVDLLGKYCNKYDRSDKYYVGGYNVQFDLGFLRRFFQVAEDKYMGSWFNGRAIDPYQVLMWLDYHDHLKLDNYKLATACAHYGITIQAHDALSDILATRELVKKLKGVTL